MPSLTPRCHVGSFRRLSLWGQGIVIIQDFPDLVPELPTLAYSYICWKVSQEISTGIHARTLPSTEGLLVSIELEQDVLAMLPGRLGPGVGGEV